MNGLMRMQIVEAEARTMRAGPGRQYVALKLAAVGQPEFGLVLDQLVTDRPAASWRVEQLLDALGIRGPLLVDAEPLARTLRAYRATPVLCELRDGRGPRAGATVVASYARVPR